MLACLISFAGGALAWSFTEYALHNWRGHLGKGRNRFSRQHLHHHADNAYFAPTSLKLWLGVQALAVVATISILLLGALPGALFTLAFFGAYTAYELLHRRCHTHAPRGWYGRWARKHHFHHHFASPKNNHGVTSPIWDLVFGTYDPPGRVRVPPKHAMSWLLDPATGAVKAEYATDYELARPRRRPIG